MENFLVLRQKNPENKKYPHDLIPERGKWDKHQFHFTWEARSTFWTACVVLCAEIREGSSRLMTQGGADGPWELGKDFPFWVEGGRRCRACLGLKPNIHQDVKQDEYLGEQLPSQSCGQLCTIHVLLFNILCTNSECKTTHHSTACECEKQEITKITKKSND